MVHPRRKHEVRETKEIRLARSHRVPVSYTHPDAADERSSVDLGGRRIIKKKKNQNNSMHDKLGIKETQIGYELDGLRRE